jgi:hypothetical protein
MAGKKLALGGYRWLLNSLPGADMTFGTTPVGERPDLRPYCQVSRRCGLG